MSTPEISHPDHLISNLLARQLLDAPRALGVAARLGRYDIVRVVGEGGLGTVLQAFDNDQRQFVAIKLPRPQYLDSRETLDLFRQEIELMEKVGELSHRHIMPLLGFGDRNGVPYFVMPFMEHGSLANRISRGTLGRPEAIAAALAVADALATVHRSLGVWHRDVKPQNILIADTDRVVLADFGLAFDVDNVARICLEQRGAVGTASYLAPEVLSGAKGDSRADIYGLGTVLRECLTGTRPTREDAFSSGYHAELDDDLIQIVQAATAPHLDERYAEMADLRDDLIRVEQGRSPLGRQRKQTIIREPKPRGLRTAATCAVLLLLVSRGVQLISSSPQRWNHLLAAALHTVPENVQDSSGIRAPPQFEKARVYFHPRNKATYFATAGFAGTELERLERAPQLPRKGEHLRVEASWDRPVYCHATIVSHDGTVSTYRSNQPTLNFSIPDVKRHWFVDGPGLIAIIVVASDQPLSEPLLSSPLPPQWQSWKLAGCWKFDGQVWTSGLDLRTDGPAVPFPPPVVELAKRFSHGPGSVVRAMIIPCQ